MLAIWILFLSSCQPKGEDGRNRTLFTEGWQFSLADSSINASAASYSTDNWRTLDLPHDWSIEGEFSKDNPAGVGGGALPGGIGWYRKTFKLESVDSSKNIFIDFDGVYMNSEVWINGHYLGKRPNGYISFRYELTPYLKFGEENTIAVKVDNSVQPNSRWYSGAGIYRNVWLVKTNDVFVDHWGAKVTTPEVTESQAKVHIQLEIENRSELNQVTISNTVVDQKGKTITSQAKAQSIEIGSNQLNFDLDVKSPHLWSVNDPFMHKLVTTIESEEGVLDTYETPLGFRYYEFDSEKGFVLNGEQLKILGVCNHHDLGALGAAVNTRALERQLEIMKAMGVNGIRTAHNPPAPELLQLCDSMGFIVMDEVFDMWAKRKSEYDYSLYWDEWHERDLVDFIKRDQNHPSIFMWSIGNEILEQWDTTGITIAKELADIVRELDDRPITSALNDPMPGNNIYKSGALDIVGFNYNHNLYEGFPKNFPNEVFIATETTSGLATRGHYDMPSDTIKRWPIAWDIPFTEGNPDNTVSAYDHVSTPWGSTHEETWKIMKKHDFLSGMYIWTGFDYLGEPTPYAWPSRSSYFGIVDLAGFPKDAYYMYQSEWTDKDVLHIFPHWTWEEGKEVDIWAYYNNADEVELYLNGESQGIRRKEGDELHVMWRLPFEPGTLKAVSRKDGKEVLSKEIHTAGEAAQIELITDRSTINADGRDLSFVTVRVLDNNGSLVPYAANQISFELEGEGELIAVDNGDPTSLESFQASQRKAFKGLALAVIRSSKVEGTIRLKASSPQLKSHEISISTH